MGQETDNPINAHRQELADEILDHLMSMVNEKRRNEITIADLGVALGVVTGGLIASLSKDDKTAETLAGGSFQIILGTARKGREKNEAQKKIAQRLDPVTAKRLFPRLA